MVTCIFVNLLLSNTLAIVTKITTIIFIPQVHANLFCKQVVVEAVASPCHIWVRIIDHAPLRRGEIPYQPSTLTLTQISMDLGLHYSDSNNRILHGQPSIGDYVCLNLDSGTCYRALVLDFSRPLGLFFHHKEQAKVRQCCSVNSSNWFP